MDAKDRKLIEFLRDKQQFVVPIYQRTYSWRIAECKRLLNDIKNVATNDSIKNHFIGSIVRVKEKYDDKEISTQAIIDGQQRLTTCTLLLAAITNYIAESNEARAEELRDFYLINSYGKDDLKYKLILTRNDKSSLISIIEKHSNQELSSNKIKSNFEFFQNEIVGEDPEIILKGIRKLMIVDICLDPEHDDPQLIFESLNSTGIKLSQADLIRNFILMGLNQDKQINIYENYWYLMEKDFDQNNSNNYFDRFMRDYLTIKNRNIPNINNVYETFKSYFAKEGGTREIDKIISDIFGFSKFYTRIALEKEENPKLKQAFTDLKELKVDVAYPFLLNIYNDFEDKIIDEKEFLEILNLIQSYIFRRSVCGIPTNSLNKTFANLYEQIDQDHYLESLKAKMILMTNYRRFPNDAEFTKELKEKDLYNIRNRNFWLRKFENFDRKEYVRVDDYTIEHIMPQNPNLSDEWKRDLGENWKEVQDNYLHTLGNLTLTGYNSELSDKPFARKKTIEGGFDQSPIRLNRSLAKFSVWNEDSIKKRADILASEMADIWQFPKISDELLDQYKEKKSEDKVYNIENMEGSHFLTDGPMRELFELFRKKVINIDSAVREEFLKLYIAYKTDTNFVDVVPQKSKLRLALNMDIDEVYDPNNLCIDVKNKGRWGNGSVEVHLNSKDQLDDVMNLVKQSFDKNSENSSSF